MWQNETQQQNEQLFPPQPPLKEMFRYPEEEAPADKSGAVSPVLKVQMLLCILLLGAVLGLRLLKLPAYEYFKGQYETIMAEDGEFLRQQEWFALAESFLEGVRVRAEETVSVWEQQLEQEKESQDEQAFQMAFWNGWFRKEAPEGCSLDTFLPAGDFVQPLASYTVSSEYGWRTDPITGKKGDFHKGIDLAAGEGQPIYAPMDGWVESVQSDGSGGNWILLRHEGRTDTRYCHMQYIFVRAGEKVSAGQILGTVGQTGQATGPHLHWELIHENLRYDPSEALGLAGAV